MRQITFVFPVGFPSKLAKDVAHCNMLTETQKKRVMDHVHWMIDHGCAVPLWILRKNPGKHVSLTLRFCADDIKFSWDDAAQKVLSPFSL